MTKNRSGTKFENVNDRHPKVIQANEQEQEEEAYEETADKA